MTTQEPTYDVFAGTGDKDALWQCSAEGLHNAKMQMQRMAGEKPGPYFVYYWVEQSIVARIDTTDNTASGAA